MRTVSSSDFCRSGDRIYTRNASVSFPDKASVLAALRESFEDVGRTLAAATGASRESVDALVVPFLEHNSEHYGQLVMYYRLNGLVPPASR